MSLDLVYQYGRGHYAGGAPYYSAEAHLAGVVYVARLAWRRGRDVVEREAKEAKIALRPPVSLDEALVWSEYQDVRAGAPERHVEALRAVDALGYEVGVS